MHDVIHETLHDILLKTVSKEACLKLDNLVGLEFWLYPERFELFIEFHLLYPAEKFLRVFYGLE
mgnify:CR=1 FL=1